MAAADVCSNCHNKDISQILEENSDLKVMKQNLGRAKTIPPFKKEFCGQRFFLLISISEWSKVKQNVQLKGGNILQKQRFPRSYVY